MIKRKHCHDLISQISEYIDGELADALCRQLEEHLSKCQNCSVVYNSMQKTIEIYREQPSAPSFPAEIRQRLYKRLRLENILPATAERNPDATLTVAAHPGDRCPLCGNAIVDYNGLLNLVCPNCGQSVGGSFT